MSGETKQIAKHQQLSGATGFLRAELGGFKNFLRRNPEQVAVVALFAVGDVWAASEVNWAINHHQAIAGAIQAVGTTTLNAMYLGLLVIGHRLGILRR